MRGMIDVVGRDGTVLKPRSKSTMANYYAFGKTELKPIIES